MRSHIKSTLHLSPREVFYFEQWAAFLVGMVCLAVSVWAGYSGFATSGTAPGAQSVAGGSAVLKCSLTVVVALLGMALVRFAFYRPGAGEPESQQSEGLPKQQQEAKQPSSGADSL